MSDDNESDTRELVATEQWEIERTKLQLAVQQQMALSSLAASVTSISQWLTTGGLEKTLGEFARATGANGMLNGLVAHDGRQALNAQTMKQNTIEVVHLMEMVRDKFQEVLKAKNANELDPDMHDGEADFKKFQEENKR
jgi:hypothetical protein